MKSKLRFASTVLALSMLLAHPAIATAKPSPPADGEISREQLEAQISFFNDALLEFGAASPDEAVRLWAKGDQTRNGVYKYAVACEQLKQQLICKWGVPEKNFWIIGTSSPWLTGCNVVSKTIISQTEIQYVIQYRWATSTGPTEPTTEQLTAQKINDKWCVSHVVQSDGYHSC